MILKEIRIKIGKCVVRNDPNLTTWPKKVGSKFGSDPSQPAFSLQPAKGRGGSTPSQQLFFSAQLLDPFSPLPLKECLLGNNLQSVQLNKGTLPGVPMPVFIEITRDEALRLTHIDLTSVCIREGTAS